MIENPKSALIEIIQAEQKNFTLFVLCASLFKIFLLGSLVSGVVIGKNFSIPSFIFFSASVVILIFIIGHLVKRMTTGVKDRGNFRIKDFFAAFSYSFTPQLFGLFILFVLEFIVFGEQMFTFNPSPFLIKKNFAYLFLSLELGITVWNIYLTKIFFSIYTDKKLPPYLASFVLIVLIHLLTIIFL
ncbi:MAG: hypothetical protein WC209_10415 [Ignavibacteriaceae bacterium]